MTSGLALAKRHALVLFFTLTYLISWMPQLFGGGLFAFGPLIASLTVVALTGGRAGLRAWWQGVARWRGGRRWYALAIALPFAINAAAGGVAVLLGAAASSADRIAAWPDLLVNFLVYAIAFGPLGEEPGWRGFALPRLLPGSSPLTRTLALSALIMAWHLPLVIGGQQPATMLLGLAAAQVLYTWLANRSGVPVLIVLLAHAAQGGLGGAFFGPMFSGADAALEASLLTALYCAAALLVVLVAGPQLGKPAASSDAESLMAPAMTGA